MKLMQELLIKPEQPEQIAEAYFSSDYNKFKRIYNKLDVDLEHLDLCLREGSQFRKIVEKLGGDLAIIKSAKEAADKLYAEMQELDMSVGMAREKNDE